MQDIKDGLVNGIRRLKGAGAKVLLKKLIIIFLLMIFAVFSMIIYHWRPLISAPEFSVSFTNGTEQRPAKAFKILFKPSVVFIQLPDGADQRYRWFALDFRQKYVASANYPRFSPYLHINYNMAIGVGLESTKIEDDWKIQWKSDKVEFANNNLRVVVKKEHD